MACDRCSFGGQREGLCDVCGDRGRHELMERAPAPRPMYREGQLGHRWTGEVRTFALHGAADLALAMSHPAVFVLNYPLGIEMPGFHKL